MNTKTSQSGFEGIPDDPLSVHFTVLYICINKHTSLKTKTKVNIKLIVHLSLFQHCNHLQKKKKKFKKKKNIAIMC